MKKANKGDYGYFTREKKKRAWITLGLFALPMLIFVSGWLYFKSRTNLMTVVAVVGCLPACKSTVGLVMALMQRSLDPEVYEPIAQAGEGLTMAYELYVTSYEKSGYVDAVAICGNEVVGLSLDRKTDGKFIGAQMQKALRQNGFGVNVRILTELNPYLERLRTLNKHKEALEKDLPFVSDERHPELSRSERIKHTLLAMAL